MAGLTSEQGRILLLGRYSDLTLVCKEVQFKVHKSIVCVASRVIDQLCSTSPEESYFQVPDPAITPNALARLLEEIYTPAYPQLDVPLLLQNSQNLRNASGVPQPPPANPAQPSNSANAPQANSGDATPTQPFLNFANRNTDSLVVKARNAFEVYICAKALRVDLVMVIAQERVLMRVSAIFSDAKPLTSFADVLAFIFESTKSGQDNLRERITSICLEKHHQCSNNAAVAAVLEEYEPSLWRIAVPLLRKTEAGRDPSIAANPAASPGLFGSAGLKPSTAELFGNAVPFTFGDGLFKNSNGVTSSGGAGGFKSGTTAYTEPAAGLFGNGASSVEATQNSPRSNGNKKVPPTQTQKPVPPTQNQKPVPPGRSPKPPPVFKFASSTERVTSSTSGENKY